MTNEDQTDRLDELETVLEQQQAAIEDHQETIKRQRDQIDRLQQNQRAASQLVGDGGDAKVIGHHRSETGETYGVKGAVSSADGYGLYTPDDARVEGVAELTALDGSLTDSAEITSLTGEGMTVSDGALGAANHATTVSEVNELIEEMIEEYGGGGYIKLAPGMWTNDQWDETLQIPTEDHENRRRWTIDARGVQVELDEWDGSPMIRFMGSEETHPRGVTFNLLGPYLNARSVPRDELSNCLELGTVQNSRITGTFIGDFDIGMLHLAGGGSGHWNEFNLNVRRCDIGVKMGEQPARHSNNPDRSVYRIQADRIRDTGFLAAGGNRNVIHCNTESRHPDLEDGDTMYGTRIPGGSEYGNDRNIVGIFERGGSSEVGSVPLRIMEYSTQIRGVGSIAGPTLAKSEVNVPARNIQTMDDARVIGKGELDMTKTFDAEADGSGATGVVANTQNELVAEGSAGDATALHTPGPVRNADRGMLLWSRVQTIEDQSNAVMWMGLRADEDNKIVFEADSDGGNVQIRFITGGEEHENSPVDTGRSSRYHRRCCINFGRLEDGTPQQVWFSSRNVIERTNFDIAAELDSNDWRPSIGIRTEDGDAKSLRVREFEYRRGASA